MSDFFSNFHFLIILKKQLLLIKPFILLSLFVFSGLAFSESSKSERDLVQSIKSDLERNKVVIVYRMRNQDVDSEQYADWADYLNTFMSKNTENYTIYKSNNDFDNRYLSNHINKNKSYTLFMRNDMPTYLYTGVIVEPPVYIAVKNVYFKNKLSARDRSFLPEKVKIDIQ